MAINKITEKLSEKLNKNVPRYTSYPVITDWKGQDENTWLNSLKSTYALGVDIYIHIPFCEKLCYYCGCFRTVTKNKEKSREYVHYLKKEWSLYLSKLPHLIKVNSIHFGGGTPSFLTPEQLIDLLKVFDNYKAPKFYGSIELDPRTVNEDHLIVLREFGFKKASLGIQDFDPSVQKAINREQSYELVKEKVDLIRKYGFDEVNFDLIWGLPKQSVKSVQDTFEKVNTLKPDRISFFSYAHLPERIKNQRLIKDSDILQGEAKLALFNSAQTYLVKNDYIPIGMDHYAKRGSKLHLAYENKTLYRNFMGYVENKSDILLGLGVSSISKNAKGFIQNIKSIKNYYEYIDAEHFPIEKGHSLSTEEAFRAEIIQILFCKFMVLKTDIMDLKNGEEIAKSLKEYQKIGLIEETDKSFKVNEEGKKYIRVIASLFDQYRTDEGAFSKAI